MKTTNLVKVPRTIDVLAAYPTGNKQGTWKYYKISTDKPISLALAENELEDFIIIDNHGKPFVGSNNLFDGSSVDTKMWKLKQ